MAMPLLDSQTLQVITSAASVIRSGKVVVCPTEGVYGLSVIATDQQAIERVINIKHRASNKGLIIVASQMEMLEGIVDFASLDKDSLELLKSSWPGHTTFIVPAHKQVLPILTGGRDTLAVRISAYNVLSTLCDKVGYPIVSTSANISGHEPIASLEELHATFDQYVDFIMDLPCQGLLKPSTIIDARTRAVLRA